MRLIFNCVVNKKGGAIQNSANFVLHSLKDETITSIYLVSSEVNEVLASWGVVTDRIYVISHPLLDKNVKSQVALIERNFRPDVVYTMAGPSYFNFKSPHVLGISDPYITHASLGIFFEGRGFSKGIVFLGKTLIKRYLSRFEGDFFLFQTEPSKKGYCSKVLIADSRCAVVPNAVGEGFLDGFSRPKEGNEKHEEFICLCPAADYPHKNLKIIMSMMDIIEEDEFFCGRKIVFRSTVSSDTEFMREVVGEGKDKIESRCRVENIGPYNYNDAAKIYADCDAVFMPTLLETFSTSYLEALAAKKVLLCSDESFSRGVCEDAAYYFDARSPSSAVTALKRTIAGEYHFDENCADKIISKYGGYSFRYNLIVGKLKSFISFDADS